MDHETAFAKAFLLSEKRARFLQYLADPKRRPEQLLRLGHTLPVLPERATVVPGAQDHPAELEKLLRARGAGDRCHVIGAGLRCDGRELALAEALRQVCLSGAGAILSCLPGRLAYYRPVAPGAGLLLERPQP